MSVQGEVRSVWWIGVVGLRTWYAKDETARQGGVSDTETLSSGEWREGVRHVHAGRVCGGGRTV